MTPPDDEPTPARGSTSAGLDRGQSPGPPANTHGRLRTARRSGLLLLLGALLSVGAGAVGGHQWEQLPWQDRQQPAPSVAAPPSTAAIAATPALRSTPDADQQRVLALKGLLRARSTAIATGDKNAWLATVDPQAHTFRAEQAVVFDNLAKVRLATFGYQYSGVVPQQSAPRRDGPKGQGWRARVLVDSQILGYDRSSSHAERHLTTVQRGRRWYIAADVDASGRREPWELGRLTVVRAQRVLVLGTGDRASLAAVAANGDTAVARVTGVWGARWSRRAVLVVPQSQAQMGLVLQRDNGLDQVAAVTTGELSDTGEGAGSDHVVVNPEAFALLGAAGRRVVLTHEMTHVAVRSTTSKSVPIWLSEGFADYVGYQGVGLSRATVAADVLALVRAGTAGLDQLPTTNDFDPARTTIAPAYSASWLACSMIADRYGEQGLVEFYREVATSDADDPEAAVAAAFRSVLGTSQQTFTANWRRYLQQLAAG